MKFIHSECSEILLHLICKNNQYQNDNLFEEPNKQFLDPTADFRLMSVKNSLCLIGEILRIDQTFTEKFKYFRFFENVEKRILFLNDYKNNSNANKLRFSSFLLLYFYEKNVNGIIQCHGKIDEFFKEFLFEMMKEINENKITTEFFSFSSQQFFIPLRDLTSVPDLDKQLFMEFIPLIKDFLLNHENENCTETASECKKYLDNYFFFLDLLTN